MGASFSDDIVTGIYGAWRLARGDARGLSVLDGSLRGFWRSFLAMALIAPPFALLLVLRFDGGMGATDPLRFASVQAISYVVAWFVFPLIMFYVAAVIERERQYLRYIVAYNWASVLQNAVYLPLAIAAELNILPLDLVSFLSFVVLTLVFVYILFITRIALAVGGLIASAIVAGDFFLSIFLNALSDAMAYAG